MKNVNKIIASLLAGSMVFSLAACGNPEGSGSNTGDTTGDTGAATAEPSTEATPAAEDGGAAAEVVKPETIKVMWDGTVFKEGENYAEAFYEALDAALGLHVEWVRPDHSGYGEQVGIAFNDMSTIADVVLLPSNYYASYAAQGNLWNMTDAWNNSDTANSGRLTEAAPLIIEQWYTAGPDGNKGIYGMYPARGNGCITYVKAAWAKNAGYESADALPTDWAGYQEFLLAMKEANGGKAPVLAAGILNAGEAPFTNYLPEFYQSAYPDFYKNADGVWVDGFTQPEMAEAMDRLAWANENGLLEKTIFEGPSTSDVRNKFFADDFGVFTYWAGTWAYTLKSKLNEAGLDDELWNLPAIKELGGYMERLSPMICITSSCQNPEGVFKYFIDPILDGGDVQMLWMYGVEGVHYEWNADHTTIDGLPSEATAGTDKESKTQKNLFEANLKIANFSGTDPYVPADAVIDESFNMFNENCAPAPELNSSEEYRANFSDLMDKKVEYITKVTQGEMTGQEAIDDYVKNYGAISDAVAASFNN